jgi:hypothetical protein
LNENSNHSPLDQEVKGKRKCYQMEYVQFILLCVKVNMASDAPENLPSPGEPGCDYGEMQKCGCNDDSVVETATLSNGKQMCSELQIDSR